MKFKLAGASNYEIGVRHRELGIGEKIVYIRFSRIKDVGRWALELDDGSSIPYHRIVEVRNERGVIIWRR